MWRLGGAGPLPVGSPWRLPTAGPGCLVDTAGAKVVVVSEDQAWRMTLPSREPLPLPVLPFSPQEVHLWQRGSRYYLLVANDERVACGVLGAPLREFDVSGYSIKEVSGAVNRVVAHVRKLPGETPGVLIFDLGVAPGVWIPIATPSSVALAPDAERLLLGSRFGSLELRSGSLRESGRLLPTVHEGSLRHAAWSGQILAAVSKHSLSIWREGDLSRPLRCGALPGKANEVMISPQGSFVLVRVGRDFLGWRLPKR